MNENNKEKKGIKPLDGNVGVTVEPLWITLKFTDHCVID
jgi:hypothetical protein